MKPMIVFFCDFGLPYLAQMKAAARKSGAKAEIVYLMADAPPNRPKLAAYLLAAYVGEFPPQSVFVCVVDPGVGSRRCFGVLQASGQWFVGPDNGLFEIVTRRASGEVQWFDGESLMSDGLLESASATFHGRDLFAPIAARISQGGFPKSGQKPGLPPRRLDWPDDLAEIIYIDCFGNAMTGIRASFAPKNGVLLAGGRRIRRARTFSDVPEGEAFWCENSNGLVEVAVNMGHAASGLGLGLGMKAVFEGE